MVRCVDCDKALPNIVESEIDYVCIPCAKAHLSTTVLRIFGEHTAKEAETWLNQRKE